MGNGAVFQLAPQRFRDEIGVVTGLVGMAGRFRRLLPRLQPRPLQAVHRRLFGRAARLRGARRGGAAGSAPGPAPLARARRRDALDVPEGRRRNRKLTHRGGAFRARRAWRLMAPSGHPAAQSGSGAYRNPRPALMSRFRSQASLRLCLDASPKGTATTILTTDRGLPWEPKGNGFRAAGRDACAKAGVRGVTFHDLRGTFATRRMADGWTTRTSLCAPVIRCGIWPRSSATSAAPGWWRNAPKRWRTGCRGRKVNGFCKLSCKPRNPKGGKPLGIIGGLAAIPTGIPDLQKDE